jgi:hypothetical protein
MMMAREGHLRKLDRRDWPSFLKRVVPAQVWQGFWGSAGRAKDPRTRWTAKHVLLCWLVMAWSLQRQSGERCREALEFLARWHPRRRRTGRTYVGLTKASRRVGVSCFQWFWAALRRELPERLGPRWRWWNWIVLAVDGSRIDAPRTRANQRKLKQAGKDKTHPQWWLTWIVHLPTHLLWDWRQGPGNSSERGHLREMLGTLPAGALLVADIGFGGYDLLADLTAEGISFLVRCCSNTTLLVPETRAVIERAGEHRWVYLWPSARQNSEPLRLRLIVLKRQGKRVYLVTNVLETSRLSRAMAGELYAARWGVEVEYRGLKQTMDHRKVLARTPQAGEMELAGAVVALGLLMLQAAMLQGARQPAVSLAGALRAMQRIMEALRTGGSTGRWLMVMEAAVVDGYQRRSKKRARDWPDKKRDPVPKAPKLRRLSWPAATCLAAVAIALHSGLG